VVRQQVAQAETGRAFLGGEQKPALALEKGDLAAATAGGAGGLLLLLLLSVFGHRGLTGMRLSSQLDSMRQAGLLDQAIEDRQAQLSNGQQEIVKISLDTKLVEPDGEGNVDLEVIEDLIVAAVSKGLVESKALMKTEMDKSVSMIRIICFLCV